MSITDPSTSSLSPSEFVNLHQAIDRGECNGNYLFDRDIELCLQALHGSAAVCSKLENRDSSLARSRFQSPKLLGHGGFGVVFAVFDQTLEIQVAIKMLRPSRNSPVAQQRFLGEAKITASLTHNCIVRMYDSGTIGDIPYITSAFITGGSLSEWLRKYPTGMPAELAVRILVQVAEAVAFAHSRLVYHRDIKPSNILIETDNSNPMDCHAVLTDFGIAKRWDKSDSALTSDGDILGTADYMSPEQASGDTEDYSVASEVFTLGIILYELLTGVTPFGKKSNSETRKAIQHESYVPLRERRFNLHKDCIAIVNKCLQKEPGYRYESVSMLAKDLQRFLDGIPVEAARPSMIRIAMCSAKKHPVVSGLLMLTMLTIGVSVMGVSYAWWHQYQSSKKEYQTKIDYVILFGKLIDDVVAGNKNQQVAIMESLKAFQANLERDLQANPADANLKHLLSLVLHYESITLTRSLQIAESLQSRIESILILKELRDRYPGNSKFRFQYLNGIAIMSQEYDHLRAHHDFRKFETVTKCTSGLELAEHVLREIDQLLRDFNKPVYVEACCQFRLGASHLIRLSEADRAEQLIRVTIRDSQQLAFRFPEELTYIKPAVIGHWKLALNSLERGHAEQAVSQAADASAFFKKHFSNHFEKAWVRVLYFEYELWHAELLCQNGRFEPALEVVHQCLPILQEMSEQDAYRATTHSAGFRLLSVQYKSCKGLDREIETSDTFKRLQQSSLEASKHDEAVESCLSYAELYHLPESITSILKNQH